MPRGSVSDATQSWQDRPHRRRATFSINLYDSISVKQSSPTSLQSTETKQPECEGAFGFRAIFGCANRLPRCFCTQLTRWFVGGGSRPRATQFVYLLNKTKMCQNDSFGNYMSSISSDGETASPTKECCQSHLGSMQQQSITRSYRYVISHTLE